ncbi:ABC transporter substrate-binding protein [bacterium]|nr:ABC transporter substrate-binding protein [bacterium]
MTKKSLIKYGGLLALLLFLSGSCPASIQAYQRVVVFNTAVSPILKQLNLDSRIVGVTFNDEVYSKTTKIGSHLSPNIELVKALQPDLIIAGSKRAYSDELNERLGADLFRYDPRTLEQILEAIHRLGVTFQKRDEARQLITDLKHKLSQVQKPEREVFVVYEVSQQPLKLAGQQNIITSIIKAAGGINIIDINDKHVLLSPEMILVQNPDLYIYQNGPMNKNPVPPRERNYFKKLKSTVWEVDQLQFTRPGLNAFDAVLALNQKIFKQLGVKKF